MTSPINGFMPLLLLVVCSIGGFARAGEPPDVRNLMTPEEYQAAGLEKLSPEQLEALNRWLLRYTAKDAPVVRRSSEVVKQEIAKFEKTAIRTRIDGEFFGWDGATVFVLEDGSVWKQRLSGRWHYRANRPEVELKRNLLGFWVLRVVERDRAIGVKRIN